MGVAVVFGGCLYLDFFLSCVYIGSLSRGLHKLAGIVDSIG